MKQSINFSQFIDAFKAHDRYDGYGYEALRVIYNYLEEYEEETGQEIELDVIAICCDYNVMHYSDIAKEYRIDLSDCEDEQEQKDVVLEYLHDNTSVLGATEDDCNIVFQVF